MILFEKSIGDKSIVIKAEKELHMQVENVFLILSKLENEKLIDDFSIQIGWSVFFLSKRNDKYYMLAPDYNKNPFKDTTDDLTLALWVQLEQVHCLRKLDINGETIKFSDKVVIAKNILQVDNIYLQRTSDCEEGDSGWYIGPVNESDDTDDLEAFYAYQLLKIRPSLIQTLALPYEYMVIFEKDEIKAVLNENDEEIWN